MSKPVYEPPLLTTLEEYFWLPEDVKNSMQGETGFLSKGPYSKN
jgi:hypothetical protein